MNRRSSALRSVERQLWAESIGHCMNPACQVELYQDGTNLGEMAHIVPHAEGGDVTLENLLMLCLSCHTQIDRNRTESTVAQLKKWKDNRNSEIAQLFEKKYPSFMELKAACVPILNRQLQIFSSYGPTDENANDNEIHELWVKFEEELIANNTRLDLMLNTNRGLLHKENQNIVDQFSSHAREFAKTREDSPTLRRNLFPAGILSLFGLEDERQGLAPNLSPFQNFVAHLKKEGKFVALELFPDQTITYIEGNEKVILNLNERSRVLQLYWDGRYYRPQTTDVRLQDLVYFIRWLHTNNVPYRFGDSGSLTELTLNESCKVKLCYSYCLSVSDLHEISIEKGLCVVNMHMWNGGPISSDAVKYAKQVGLRLFNCNQFFAFAHRRLRA